MRLVASHGPRHVVTRSSHRLLPAACRIQNRTINTRPRSERPPPIIEQINLRPQPNPRAQSIGILGGGVTGLTTAWHLSRFVPDAKITIYEKQDRVGGWLDSDTIEVDGGRVLFEWGPRSLRPDPAGSGRATILLLLQLELIDQILRVDKRSPAALNRFLYYGDRLVQMPGPNPTLPPFLNAIRNAYKVLTEPIFKGVLGSIFAEYWVQPRSTDVGDESVGSFIRRRFGQTAADNIASAFFHGIYAGDLYKLSARTLLPALWHMETRDPEGAGILMEMTDIAFKGQGLMQFKHGRYVDLLEAMADHNNSFSVAFMQEMHSDTSVYTFVHGLQTLGSSLQKKLLENPNVEFKTEADIAEAKFDSDTKKINLKSKGSDEVNSHDYVVSTLSAGKLAEFMDGSNSQHSAKQALQSANKAVTVAVVNLYYSDPNLIPENNRGFGYLIPRSVDVDQNPERALGVIFGSETSGLRGEAATQNISDLGKARIEFLEQIVKQMKQKTEPQGEGLEVYEKQIQKEKEKLEAGTDDIAWFGQDSAPGTKLTVMLGGHWWDGWAPEDIPDEEQCINMAKSILARHLKITEAPKIAKARVNRECIPQYTVGYRQQMASIHKGLMETYKGRMKVAGPWWQGGVGVNDCVLSGHLTAFNIREEWEDETGLKEYTEREKWLICDRRTQTFSVDPVR